MNWIKNLFFSKNVLLLLFVLFFLALLSNFAVNYLANQKNFPILHNKLFYKDVHTVIAPDLSNGSGTSYLFIGDSYAQGAGDSYLNGDYNYSIAHRFSKNQGVNVVNTGLGGASSLGAALYAIEMKKIFDFSPFLEDFPDFEKVFIFFYEGNDLNNNIDEITRYSGFEGIDDRINKSENISVFDLIKRGYFYGINFFRVNIHRPLKIKWDIYRKGEYKPKKVNKITIGGEEYNVKNLQSAAMELTDRQIDSALMVFEKSLKLIKKVFNKSQISVVYLPSPTTTYSSNGSVIIQTYQNGENKVTYKDNLDRSSLIRNRILKITKDNSVAMIDVTNDVINEAKSQPLHGTRDWSHFNKDGYSVVYKSIINKM